MCVFVGHRHLDWRVPDVRVRGVAGVRAGELRVPQRRPQEASQTAQVGAREGGSTRGRRRRTDDTLWNGN